MKMPEFLAALLEMLANRKESIALNLTPVLAAILLLAIVVVFVFRRIFDLNQGAFAYSLDDAYIHLTLARNLAAHGVLGMTPTAFSSCESSLLWGVVLAGIYHLVGADWFVAVPAVLNCLLSMVFLFSLDGVLRKNGVSSSWLRFLALAFAAFACQLPWLIVSGMEHVLQMILAVAFLGIAVRWICDEHPGRSLPISLMILAPLFTMVRYEDVTIFGVIVLAMMIRKRFLAGLIVGITGALPLIIFALISTRLGWFPVPSSIVLKSHLGDRSGLLNLAAWNALVERPAILILFIASFALGIGWWFKVKRVGDKSKIAPQLAALTVWIGWFVSLQTSDLPTTLNYVRYESSLVALTIFAVTLQINALLSYAGELRMLWDRLHAASAVARLSIGIVGLFALIFAGFYTADSLWSYATKYLVLTPTASHNIYNQQVQMARFVHANYPGASIALNDIGAVNYWSDMDLTDFAGLATIDVAKARVEHRFDDKFMADYAQSRGTQFAIIYDSWLPAPKSWRRVATWQIPDNVICGDSIVSFYAVKPGAEGDLRRRLERFSAKLPREVVVKFASE